MNLRTDFSPLLGQPRGEQLDFFPTLPGSMQLAQQFAAFANHRGGWVLLGISDVQGNPEVIGISEEFAIHQIVEKAFALLMPPPDITTHTKKIGKRLLFGIKISPSEVKILLDGVYFVRKESQNLNQPLVSPLEQTKDEIKALLAKGKIQRALDKMAEGLPDLGDETVRFSQRLSDLKSNETKGYITLEDGSAVRNRLVGSILETLK